MSDPAPAEHHENSAPTSPVAEEEELDTGDSAPFSPEDEEMGPNAFDNAPFSPEAEAAMPGVKRSTPFSPEAEEAVLGAILSNPGAWFGIAAFLQQDDFFLLRHRWIWEAMQRISERNETWTSSRSARSCRSWGTLSRPAAPPGSSASLTTRPLRCTPKSTAASSSALRCGDVCWPPPSPSARGHGRAADH